MAKSTPLHRKRRTRQHVIADLSVNFVERFILESGHTAQRLNPDYGYDLLMVTFDEQGYPEPDLLYLQLKATESLALRGGGYTFELDVRDYNRWMREPVPVLLVLFDASRRKAFWVFIQRYFAHGARPPRAGARTVRVRVPARQAISRRGIAAIRACKREEMETTWRTER